MNPTATGPTDHRGRPGAILVLHRVPWPFIGYDAVIDHARRDVTYVGTAAQLANVPAALRCTRSVIPGTGDLVAEVLAAVAPPFDRVVAMSQFQVNEAARLRVALGVPGQTPDDVDRVDNKLTMKANVAAAGLAVPRAAACIDALAGDAVPRWTGATILKPISGTGSRGVRRCDSVNAALERLRADPTLDPAGYEIEEFVDAPILHFDGLMLGGEAVVNVASRYMGSCLEYAEGAPQASVQLDDDADRCGQIVPFLAALGICNGPFHLEMFDKPEGLVFLEVGARTGGGEIGERVRLTTGVDLVKADLALQVDSSPLARHPSRALLVPTPNGQVFGDFMFPGHLLPSRYCRVLGGAPFRKDPRVVLWNERPIHEPVSGDISYNHFDLPLSGIVTGASTIEVGGLLRALLAGIRIEPTAPPPGSP